MGMTISRAVAVSRLAAYKMLELLGRFACNIINGFQANPMGKKVAHALLVMNGFS